MSAGMFRRSKRLPGCGIAVWQSLISPQRAPSLAEPERKLRHTLQEEEPRFALDYRRSVEMLRQSGALFAALTVASRPEESIVTLWGSVCHEWRTSRRG